MHRKTRNSPTPAHTHLRAAPALCESVDAHASPVWGPHPHTTHTHTHTNKPHGGGGCRREGVVGWGGLAGWLGDVPAHESRAKIIETSARDAEPGGATPLRALPPGGTSFYRGNRKPPREATAEGSAASCVVPFPLFCVFSSLHLFCAFSSFHVVFFSPAYSSRGRGADAGGPFRLLPGGDVTIAGGPQTRYLDS